MKSETAEKDIVNRLRTDDVVWGVRPSLAFEAADEIERLRGALRTIDDLIPKSKEITDFPYWMAVAGDVAESALNGTWPAYGVIPASVKERK